MPYIDVNIDVDEFYDSLDRYEKRELLELLKEDLDDDISNSVNNTNKLVNGEFIRECHKLGESYYRMEQEDIETIRLLVKKYKFY